MTASATSLSVTVAISTLGAGLERIRLPAPRAGLDYLILLQRPQEAPAPEQALLAGRGDVTLVPLDSLGLSNSRNAALDLACGDLLLFSDDDVTLDPAGILALRDRFAVLPDLVLAAGWRAERLPKGAREQALSRFNSGRICAPEFMVRREATAALGVRFDPAFGLGARHGVGEDYVFVTDILRAGGRGRAVPVTVGAHPHESTGDRWDDPALLAARRAVIDRVFGPVGPGIWALFLLRHRRRFDAALPWLRAMFRL
ncbi:glycosyltransferase family 2 protein [Phaeobacter sp. B1627]|uniref:glycosyltransferase family 2 protein n=1 Tax=Phaeobacter sp. B1627 TaxID=2583809 RepID=UPI00111B4A2D|nr:glycosyltransferase family 2 protein [Phaeobacter sp. B1627]TNJ40944.1 glycosyltransferase [Phaeobacter sp. B1627]